jgi:hypothetical protein
VCFSWSEDGFLFIKATKQISQGVVKKNLREATTFLHLQKKFPKIIFKIDIIGAHLKI